MSVPRGGPPLAARAERFRRRFLRHVTEGGLLAGGEHAVVACSGGLDSTVLLHLLRFSPELGVRLTAAHYDHAMRPGSDRDALWLRGLARAWEIPYRSSRAGGAPSGEAAARDARYVFLREVQRAGGALLLTAHQADDQAETVLFRVLRGTGPRGLAGIPERGEEGLLRPLLPFRRAELERYAGDARVPCRRDPTNADLRYARNVLRHEVLPRVERAVAPGAVRSLARLARLAREEEEAWQGALSAVLEPLLLEAREDRIVVDRTRLLAASPALRARLLRELLGRLAVVQDEAGTRAALEFTSSGASGRGLQLPGGLVLAREFDRFVLARPSPARDGSLEIERPGEGSGCLMVGGRRHRIEWSRAGGVRGTWTEAFAIPGLDFPLHWRGWRPGDRIRLRYGSKKLAKLFAEARIPAGERRRWPLMEDGSHRLLWVPGLAREEAPPRAAEEMLTIGVTEIDPA